MYSFPKHLISAVGFFFKFDGFCVCVGVGGCMKDSFIGYVGKISPNYTCISLKNCSSFIQRHNNSKRSFEQGTPKFKF